MSIVEYRYCICILLSFSFVGSSVSADDASDAKRVLFSFDDESQLAGIEARDMKLSIAESGSGTKLQVQSGHEIDWPGITLKPKGEFWDGSPYQRFAMDVSNTGDTGFELGLRIDNPGGDGQTDSVTVMTFVKPGESRTVSASLSDTPWQFSKPLKLHGMHAAPGQQAIDPAKIKEVILFLRTPNTDHQFTIDNVRFEKPVTVLDRDAFLPFIDEYGQYIHGEWPGKIHSDEQLIQNRESEQKELAEHPGPKSFNRFGGWQDGPKSEPGKFFRTEKHDGKWWLIDPDGCRFWSHGIDAVSIRFGGTGIDDREDYFRNLPSKDVPLGQFYNTSTWAFGFYADRVPFEMYNFYTANLYRKYGGDWPAEFADVAHKRLRSWGLNTLASWSDPAVYLQHRTPYTAFVYVEDCPTLDGAQKMWTKFADVFDPKFRESVVAGIEKCGESIGDPWCLGFYVDNELFWGDNNSLALWTLACPATQAAKQTFVADLKAKYETIEKLNEAWGTAHENWEAFTESTTLPDAAKAADDLHAFSVKFAETYFATVKDELDKAAPGQLYLGCRFIWFNDVSLRAASDSCDVVSFNQYRYDVSDLHSSEGTDRPIMIGEFHFGALDRGLFHPTKVPARDQEHRAECYKDFLHSALANPNIVGTHWFQYTSEPTAGRGDGENYQVGFVDNCDTPYEETINAARQIGREMYEYRAASE
ncbi:hypothetical protein Poly51_20010 [Rubripirellula tenax]|uniref:Beta-agarase n=1 Tax=Rubripirellula tenax TaxID=2528015 RepID=A0A5C6FCS5_9BACT|nr:beta-galactosidase [Rubripirellula tenax]TWU59215.1 hypothetical protein Poly51_20010 [Rubripirellula tenax]